MRRQYLTQPDTPLVKTVDTPNRATDKHTVFLQRQYAS
jgi:hypothetical protein